MTRLVGLLAAFLTTMSFVPQTIKIIQTQKTDDISTPMYLMLVSGIVLWLIYGILRKDKPLVLANIVSLIFSGSVLMLKLFY